MISELSQRTWRLPLKKNKHMKKIYFALIILLATLFISCSSGKKALQKGDYFSAGLKAVNRLKSSPNNQNAIKVLEDGYPLLLDWEQEEMDNILTGNNTFKWEDAINLMTQQNNLANEIRRTPAARKIIPNPKMYSSELNMALEKAAEARYNAGIFEMKLHTQKSARQAYTHFVKTNQFVPDYKDVAQLLYDSKKIATVTVILETIPLNAIKYKLSSEFFYNQIYNYLNDKFPQESFVNFYSPDEAEYAKLTSPDFVVRIEFYDFTVGNTIHKEVEKEVKRKVKIESKDSTRTTNKTYLAKLKTFTDQVTSEGVVNLKVIDFKEDELLRNQQIPGSFIWVNNYAIFVGDIEALDNKQVKLTERKVAPLPPKQDLFIEFTKPIYDQLTNKLRSFFRKYS